MAALQNTKTEMSIHSKLSPLLPKLNSKVARKICASLFETFQTSTGIQIGIFIYFFLKYSHSKAVLQYCFRLPQKNMNILGLAHVLLSYRYMTDALILFIQTFCFISLSRSLFCFFFFSDMTIVSWSINQIMLDILQFKMELSMAKKLVGFLHINFL